PADADPSAKDIGFGIALAEDGYVYIYEGGNKVPGLGPNGSVATYNAGDRFRVRVTDNNDPAQTATITYTMVTPPCMPGMVCAEIPIGSKGGSSPSYPLEVDASLVEQGATLTNVTLVRIR